MAIRQRMVKMPEKPEKEMTLYELMCKRQSEGCGALIVCAYDGKWQVSMLRGDKTSHACVVGRPGEPLEIVMHNCMVLCYDRKHWNDDNVSIADKPVRKKLIIRAKPKTGP